MPVLTSLYDIKGMNLKPSSITLLVDLLGLVWQCICYSNVQGIDHLGWLAEAVDYPVKISNANAIVITMLT